jgi:hypothetical protein
MNMAQRKVNCEVYTDRGIVGERGADGADGKSAYEQAVDGGYEGTEEEFEEALASDITTVADNISDINTVGSNISDVNTVANNMAAIIAAPTAATQAAASASQAATSATNAQTSETNAATSASNAATSASNASASATTASTKASEAITSATSASASAASASTSATSASTSATNAEIWAEGTDSQVTPLGGEHSAKGWANIAKQYAESIGAALKYKGSVSTYSALPSTGQEIGDTWNVLDTGDNYAWTGTEWDKLSGTVDLSAYRTAAAQDLIDATKQDTLVSGTNIKTVNNTSLLGSGDITIDSLPSQSGQSGKFLTTDGTDASWSDVPAPAGVYTEDNLVAGTNISLTEQTISGGIDANTLALLHFDGNLNDASQYSSTCSASFGGGVLDYLRSIDGHTHFDQFYYGLNYGKVSLTNSNVYKNKQNYTFDYWFYCVAETYNAFTSSVGFDASSKTVYLTVYPEGNKLKISGYPISTLTKDLDFTIERSAWHHVAMTYNHSSTTTTVYLDGQNVWEINNVDLSIPNSGTTIKIGGGETGGAQTYLDEFRFSDVVRYNGNFTPPTGPYTSGSTTVTSINNTMSAPSVMTGATSGAAGTSGLVPAPAAGDQAKYLTGAGTWATVDALPSQTGHSGEFLTTNGTTPSWAGLPDISGKANVSLDNLSSAGKSLAAGLGMPLMDPNHWVSLTLGARGTTYTMPEDGLVCFDTAGGTVGGYILLVCGNCTNLQCASQTYEVLRSFLFVPKGYVFAADYVNAGTLTAFGYYKLKGNAV